MTENTNPNAVDPENIESKYDADADEIRRIVIAAQHEVCPYGLAVTEGRPLAY